MKKLRRKGRTSMDEVDGAEVVSGPPESWEDFAERMQRQVGNGARVFLCRQVGMGDATAAPFIMVLRTGPIRPDLL